jgi:hypothetical protein
MTCSCGNEIAPVLSRLGSSLCHDCRVLGGTPPHVIRPEGAAPAVSFLRHRHASLRANTAMRAHERRAA